MVLRLLISLVLRAGPYSLPKPSLYFVSLHPGNAEQAKCTCSNDCFSSNSPYDARSSGKGDGGEKKRNQGSLKAPESSPLKGI